MRSKRERPTEYQVLVLVEIIRLYVAKLDEKYIANKVHLSVGSVQKVLRILARFGPRFNPREDAIEED